MSQQEQDFVGELMGFNPSDLTVFQEGNQEKDYNKNIYKTNPVSTKVASEDGHYRSTIRIIYNPFDVKRSIVNQCQYVLRDENGMFFVNSALADGDRNCPIFKGWKKLHFSGDPEKDEFAKKMFEKNESMWVLVQVIEDKNKPEEEGKLKVMKLPRTIYNKLQAKMNPSAESKKSAVALMDYLLGPVLEMDVVPGPDDPKQPSRKMREINYDLCDFGTDPNPIVKVDGTPLFNDDELETIDAYATAKTNMEKARTEEKRNAFKQEALGMVDDMKKLYKKALDYLKDNAPDLVAECGYTPWSDEVTKRVENWLNAVLDMRDPANSDGSTPADAPTFESPTSEAESADQQLEAEVPTDDLPF